MSVNSKMTAIADAIRAKTGINGTLTLDEMAAAIASIEVDSGEGITVTSVSCDIVASNGKLIGDVNGDGKVDSIDEELAAQYMAEGVYDAAADFDGDGEITVPDMIQFTNLISELKTGQIIAKVSIEYSNGEKASGYFPIDAPSFEGGGESGKTIKSVSCTTTVSSGVLIGDVNNDGKIDSTDEELASQCMMDGGYNAAIDFDEDGVIGVADMVQFSGVLSELEEGQIIAKITIVYSDGTSRIEYKPVDKGKIPSGGASNVVHFDTITSTHGLVADSFNMLMVTGMYYVKASDNVYLPSELIGKTYRLKTIQAGEVAEEITATIEESNIGPVTDNGTYIIGDLTTEQAIAIVVPPEDVGFATGLFIPPSAGTYLLWFVDTSHYMAAEIDISGELSVRSTEVCEVNISYPGNSYVMFYGGLKSAEYNTPHAQQMWLDGSNNTKSLLVGKGMDVTMLLGAGLSGVTITGDIHPSIALYGNLMSLVFRVMGDGEITFA